jgi:hypothetical protein
VEDVGFEGPSTEITALSWWVGEKDEHALIWMLLSWQESSTSFVGMIPCWIDS